MSFWECSACTCHNNAIALACGACATVRPDAPPLRKEILEDARGLDVKHGSKYPTLPAPHKEMQKNQIISQNIKEDRKDNKLKTRKSSKLTSGPYKLLIQYRRKPERSDSQDGEMVEDSFIGAPVELELAECSFGMLQAALMSKSPKQDVLSMQLNYLGLEDRLFPIRYDKDLRNALALYLFADRPCLILLDQESNLDLQRQLQDEEASLMMALKLEQEEKDRVRKRKEEERVSEELAKELQGQLMDEKLARDIQRAMEEEQNLRVAMAEQQKEDKKEAEEKAKRSGPGYWTELLPPDQAYRRVQLAEDHAMYELVKKQFAKCNRAIVKVEYVQNPTVWNRYKAAKESTGIREVYRFHGTPGKNVEGICKLGLTTRLDVSGGGTTIWSAEDPNYSVGYAQKGPVDNLLTMFLCRVLSAQDSVSTVRDDSHIFPEFLLTFK